jgi:lipopolysaccharide transport system permease protein
MQESKSEKELVIRPPTGFGKFDPVEYYRYRHMLMSLVNRDIKSQFDEMHLGFIWAVIRPLTVAFVFTFFKHFSGANSSLTIPYLVYVYSGLVFWYYFTDATMQTAGSVKKDASIISKIYFPRLIVPMVPIMSNLIGLGVAMVPLAIMIAWYHIMPSLAILLLPVVIVQCMLFIFGLGTLFAALTINNRDMEQFLSFALYIGLFVSPIFFVPELLPSWARALVFLNPMSGTLLALRACLFEGIPFPVANWMYSLGISCLMCLIGSLAFRRAELTFVDKL